jgi:hypothetical protein
MVTLGDEGWDDGTSHVAPTEMSELRLGLVELCCYFSDISFKKTFCLMNIRPQDLLSHEPTLLV